MKVVGLCRRSGNNVNRLFRVRKVRLNCRLNETSPSMSLHHGPMPEPKAGKRMCLNDIPHCILVYLREIWQGGKKRKNSSSLKANQNPGFISSHNGYSRASLLVYGGAQRGVMFLGLLLDRTQRSLHISLCIALPDRKLLMPNPKQPVAVSVWWQA